ncbi:MAG: DUF1178 family protein [Hyphomicrobiaceae bacterium]
MIRYQLQCDASHTFEAWFGNSSAFDAQVKRGLVACPQCGSTKVEKCIMAPNVGIKGNKRADVSTMKAANTDAAEQSPSFAELRALMRRMREEVEQKAEYVGPNFAEEARKIHYEEAEARGIYGEATMEEAKSLQEEGIEFLPLPSSPDDRN